MKGYHRTIVRKPQPVGVAEFDYRKLVVPNRRPLFFGVVYKGMPKVAHLMRKPQNSATAAMAYAKKVKARRDHLVDLELAAKPVIRQEAAQEVAQPELVLA